jgi:cytochrome c peroxidase
VNRGRQIPGGRARRCACALRRLGIALLWALGIAALAGCRIAPPSPPASPAADVGAALGLSPDDVEAIVAHGPWPPRFERDPGNRASGEPAAIELGRRLFTDPRLSADGTRACMDCHRPEWAFADGRPRSPGRDGQPLDRNAPGLLDVRLMAWLGWDGSADSLWSFVMRPLADPREIGADDTKLAALLREDTTLACLRRAAFGDPAPAGEAARVQVAKALAAWMETLESPRTRFDAFRDALAAGDTDRARRYPADALRGLRNFVGDGRCALCHVGPTFTNGEFSDTGRPHMAAPGRPDPGRHGGVQAVRADPYNRLGRWNDGPAGPASGSAEDPAVRTRHLVATHRNFGEFRVPGLRALTLTAPYGHDGSMATLEDVITHYSELDIERLHADGEAVLRPLRLDARARADLLAFLRTLSEPIDARGPASVPVSPHPCVRASGP